MRNPSANRLVLPLEKETRARALELALMAPTPAGDYVLAQTGWIIQRATEFAKFIDTGNINGQEPETTA